MKETVIHRQYGLSRSQIILEFGWVSGRVASRVSAWLDGRMAFAVVEGPWENLLPRQQENVLRALDESLARQA